MKRALVLFALAFAPAAAAEPYGVVGDYAGTCQAWYDDVRANPCHTSLSVDDGYFVTVYGDAACISPTDFTGALFDDTAELRSAPWNAQPQGQTLDLRFTFDRRERVWVANGSGFGMADRKWRYRCTFRQFDFGS